MAFGCITALLSLAPCPQPAVAAETETAASALTGKTAELLDEESQGEEGFATYYAKRYAGRRTNSGVRYNPEKLTAAHPTLPHGTKVKVINLANDREVIVTVNDRCRARKEPFIDLSRAAARELGFLGKGKTRVRIIPLEES